MLSKLAQKFAELELREIAHKIRLGTRMKKMLYGAQSIWRTLDGSAMVWAEDAASTPVAEQTIGSV